MTIEYPRDRYPEDFTGKPWPKDFKYEKPGHRGFYKTINTPPKTSSTGSTEKERFAAALDEIAKEIADIVYGKHLDYGSNAILGAPYGAIPGVVTRLHDKISRAANLTKGDVSPKNESLKDTFIDIAGYAIIAITLLDENFPKK